VARVIGREEDAAVRGQVFHSDDLAAEGDVIGHADEVVANPIQPLHPDLRKCLAHAAPSLAAIGAAIFSTTSGRLRNVVSIEVAPAGHASGAVLRVESIRSRSVIESWWPSLARRRARSSGCAWRKKRKSASGKITEPMSRPSITRPRRPRWRATSRWPRW